MRLKKAVRIADETQAEVHQPDDAGDHSLKRPRDPIRQTEHGSSPSLDKLYTIKRTLNSNRL
ncbi:MAG: hypothetical protein Q7S80_00030 [bacterium]|nr:hypothetical protein [bacterium]